MPPLYTRARKLNPRTNTFPNERLKSHVLR
uniref:Uncharacterized protein n=1 Tax=Phage sp. ctL4h4 TaxID=2828005 RepID=A0A8S5TFG5_9VIRU|nr:MAG TPA: hypothetical protein [Phage sp. ctL4h4]